MPKTRLRRGFETVCCAFVFGVPAIGVAQPSGAGVAIPVTTSVATNIMTNVVMDTTTVAKRGVTHDATEPRILPSACVDSIQQINGRMRHAIDRMREDPNFTWSAAANSLVNGAHDTTQTIAARCIAAQPPAQSLQPRSPQEEIAMAQLYVVLEQRAQAVPYLVRAATAPGTAAERATRAAAALRILGRGSRDTVVRTAIIRLIAIIDSGTTDPGARVEARSRLVQAYGGPEDSRQRYQIASEILDIVSAADTASRRRLAVFLANMSRSIGGDREEKDYAAAFVARAATLMADVPEYLERLTADIDRDALIGKPAPPIVAAHWLNATSSGLSERMPVHGAVTLLEFTAHWCGPCKGSYRPLQALADTLGLRGFHLALVTQLYGSFDDQDMASSVEELAADSAFFLRQYGFRVPIAIGGDIHATHANDHTNTDQNFLAYRVGGIPYFVLVDTQGRIVRTWTGWTARIGAEIRSAAVELLEALRKTPVADEAGLRGTADLGITYRSPR